MHDERVDMYDVYDGGDEDMRLLGKAKNAEEAGKVALDVFRSEGYSYPEVCECRLIPASGGDSPFYIVDIVYADLRELPGKAASRVKGGISGLDLKKPRAAAKQSSDRRPSKPTPS